MKLDIKKGTTSKLIEVFISDSSSTTGAGLTGVAFGDITGYYYRSGAAGETELAALKTMTLGTWATEGFIEIDATNMPGYYQLGLPNTALVSGADQVNLMLKGAANMAPLPIEIQLVDNVEKDTFDIVGDGAFGNAQLMRTSDKGGRTVTTNSDKTGYALADPNLSKADVSGLAVPGSAMNLADDAITAEKFDETTAFPVKSDDSGVTLIARSGADGDDLKDVADAQVVMQVDLDNPDQYKADVSGLALSADMVYLKGALGFNAVLDDFTYVGNKATAGTLYMYDSRANALANDKSAATGLLFKQTLSAVVDGNSDTTKLTRTDEVVT